MIQYPITPDQERKIAEEKQKPVKFNISDFGTGFMDENLPAIAVEYMMNNQDFPPDENYNPKEDPQIAPYQDFYDHFLFSKSVAETSAIIDKLNKNAEANYSSPWYHLGRITGAFADPSTLLLWTKVGQGAKVFGTAFAAEEIAKQQLDVTRDDSYVPWVVAGGYGVPYILNKMAKGTVGAGVQQKVIDADRAYNTAPKQITQQIFKFLFITLFSYFYLRNFFRLP